MFERYSEEARRALFFARARTGERAADAISAEDLLHGILLAAPDTVSRFASPPGALVPDESAEAYVTRVFRGDASSMAHARREFAFSAEARRVLDRAAAEADSLQQATIAPGHLLAGLLRDEDTGAWRRLGAAGVTLRAVRQHLADPTA